MTTLDSRVTGRTTRATLRRSSRAAQWRSSWNLALRMGRRDAWRHKGRSLLVLAMVALPVLLLTGGLTLLATRDISPAEELPGRLGSAAALVTGISAQADVQDPAGIYGTCRETCPASKPLPGGATSASSPADVRTGIERLFGSPVVMFTAGGADTTIGDRRVGVSEVFADAGHRVFRGRFDLTSGRWAKGTTEIVVTEEGVEHGLPASGTLELSEQGPKGRTKTTYTVVGTARTGIGESTDIVRPATETTDFAAYLVDRDTPVTWDEVRAANEYGLTVASRAVIENPPPADATEFPSPNGSESLLVTALLVAALFVVSALLAGPAFAVIAQRQRHALATAACNGATTRQLRRTVLGQALVLGVAGSLVASALGLALTPVGMRLVELWRPSTVWGPFDIPGWQLALVLGCAMISSVTAALLPARGLGRLDVVGALRGQASPRPARRAYPLVGLALAAVGTAANWYAFDRASAQASDNLMALLVVGGTLLLVVGALLTVPMLLVGIGRLSGSMPAWVRMAARDNARERTRATPTVAAVMAGSILFSGLAIGFGSFDTNGAREYEPGLPDGWASYTGLDSTDPTAAQTARRVISEVVPGARTVTLADLQLLSREEVMHPSPSPRQTTAYALPAPGCSASALSQWTDGKPCHGVMFGDLNGATATRLYVVDPADLDALPQLDASARQALARGEIVTSTEGLQGRVPMTRLTIPDGSPDSTPVAAPAGHAVVHHIPASDLDRIGDGGNQRVLALVTPAGAKALGAQWVSPSRILLHSDRGLRQEDLDRASERLDTMSEMFYVERGYVSPLRGLQWILFATVLAVILVATVTATALAIGEAQRDLSTLSAVGAPHRLRRLLAAAQAGLLAASGTVVGLLVGAVPGVIWSYFATKHDVGDTGATTSDLTIPWMPLGAAVVVIPALAAALAALLVRSRPTLTRRAG